MEESLSKYAFLLQTESKENLVYVSRSNGFYKIPDIVYNTLNLLKTQDEKDKLYQLDKSYLDFLRNKKIIVSKGEDEDYLLELELKSNLVTYSQQSLGLVIAPTTGCNFACPYCFEENKKVNIMSDYTIDNLFNFIRGYVNIKYLNLTWYGGEPLLAFEVIKRILPRIKEELPIELRMHQIVTNGYYFNKEVVDFFKSYPLNLIQITLDGKKERHDSIRRLKGSKKGSYSQIMENMDLIVKELPDTILSVRVNLDNNNKEDFEIIFRELKNRWPGSKLDIYPGAIRIDDEKHRCLSCEAMSHSDIRNFYCSLHDREKVRVDFYPRMRPKACSATCLNAYVVGPDGELYKCWNDVSDPHKIIGYLNQKDFTNKKLLARYLIACNCFKNPECRECLFLPICMGGCAWYKLRNLYENGQFEMCSLYKDENALKKCLLLHYESLVI